MAYMSFDDLTTLAVDHHEITVTAGTHIPQPPNDCSDLCSGDPPGRPMALTSVTPGTDNPQPPIAQTFPLLGSLIALSFGDLLTLAVVSTKSPSVLVATSPNLAEP